jgi:hypothetical protein
MPIIWRLRQIFILPARQLALDRHAISGLTTTLSPIANLGDAHPNQHFVRSNAWNVYFFES